MAVFQKSIALHNTQGSTHILIDDIVFQSPALLLEVIQQLDLRWAAFMLPNEISFELDTRIVPTSGPILASFLSAASAL